MEGTDMRASLDRGAHPWLVLGRRFKQPYKLWIKQKMYTHWCVCMYIIGTIIQTSHFLDFFVARKKGFGLCLTLSLSLIWFFSLSLLFGEEKARAEDIRHGSTRCRFKEAQGHGVVGPCRWPGAQTRAQWALQQHLRRGEEWSLFLPTSLKSRVTRTGVSKGAQHNIFPGEPTF